MTEISKRDGGNKMHRVSSGKMEPMRFNSATSWSDKSPTLTQTVLDGGSITTVRGAAASHDHFQSIDAVQAVMAFI